MAKLISPARMPERKKLFCSSDPKRMSIGPTVLSVTNGNGARARCTSVKKMNWSDVGLPWPPYSFGQPIPSHPSLPMRRTSERKTSPPSLSVSSARRTSGVNRSAK